MLLMDIQKRLLREGKRMSDFGLEDPGPPQSELEVEKERFLVADQTAIALEIRNSFALTDEQSVVVDAVLMAVDNPRSPHRYFAIHGIAGSGKTSVARLISAETRRRGKIVKICAATTLAAQLYDHATTAHTLFKYPVIDEEDVDIENLPLCR
jgi:RecG-like helicase